jgi:hypothetical protein
MTTQPQSPSEQEIRDCIEQAASTDYKVMCLQALIAQAADKREQEVLDALLVSIRENLDARYMPVRAVNAGIKTRLAQLRQGRAAEGEGKL